MSEHTSLRTDPHQQVVTEEHNESRSTPAQRGCPECDGTVTLDESRAERVCQACGTIVDADRIDHGPEWRAFTNEESARKRRVGAPTTPLLHDKGLSTVIDWRDTDASGKSLSSRQQARMRRLRVWDERCRTKTGQERNLKQALGEIERMASAVGLPDSVTETAGVLYRRAVTAGLLPGRSIEAMATACLYAATRQAGLPRRLREFAPVSRVDQIHSQRAYRYLTRELGLELPIVDPRDYIQRFISALDLTAETEQLACDLIATGTDQNLHSGKSPAALAAGAVYAASRLTNDARTQAAVSEIADVSRTTIRNRYQELLAARTRMR
jgi:transcription initiation factor TFIIB